MTLESASIFGGPAGLAAPVISGDGWQFVERGDLGAVQLVAADEGETTLSALGASVGVTLPATGRTVELVGEGGRVIGLSPRWWLLECPLSAEPAWVARIADAVPGAGVLVTAFGDHLPWFDLTGPRAESLLSAGAFLHLGGPLTTGRARRMLLAQVPVVLVRLREQAWRLGIERSRAFYFRYWLAAAAQAGSSGDRHST